MLKKHFFFLFSLVAFPFGLFAQGPVLTFLVDSVLIGEPAKAVFYYRHPSDQEIVFPDSNFSYAPFEFVDKQFFPTRTVNGISTDSAVYTLSLFEPDGVHYLSMPVFHYKGKDTIRINSQPDSITIRPLITSVSDSLQLKSNTSFIPLETNFNYLIFLAIIIVLLILTIVGYLVFGKQILRAINRYRLKIVHKIFISNFNSLVSNLNSTSKMEEAVSLWKKHIERLDAKPYTTYTSTEIAYHLKNESIRKNLQNIDAAIYGGRFEGVAEKDFSVLLDVAVQLYQNNIKTT